MPGWDGYPIRERFAARYDAPVWVDNDVNLLAMGEWRSGVAAGHDNVVVVKVGTGIGAGIISDGHLHRGAQGSAGDVGHIQVTEDPPVICRCGNIGCLEALAGGGALGRAGETAALEGRSERLRLALDQGGSVSAQDVARAASFGDPAAVALLQSGGRRIGSMLASVVNFFNPSLVVIGGGVANSPDQFLASIREAVYRRSLPLATRDLLDPALVARRPRRGHRRVLDGRRPAVRARVHRPLDRGGRPGAARRRSRSGGRVDRRSRRGRGRRRGRRGRIGGLDRGDRERARRREHAAHRRAAVPRRDLDRGPRHVLRLLHARHPLAQGRRRDRRRGRGRAARARPGRRAPEHLRRRHRDHLPRRAPQGRLGAARPGGRRPDPAPRDGRRRRRPRRARRVADGRDAGRPPAGPRAGRRRRLRGRRPLPPRRLRLRAGGRASAGPDRDDHVPHGQRGRRRAPDDRQGRGSTP